MKPTDDYLKAVDDIAKHHKSSKTFSGKFLRPHYKVIKKIIDEFDIKSILDYGCGKGEQYLWRDHGVSIEEHWGIETFKYDPCVPKFSKEPKGKFDLVICTHVLGCIPEYDLEKWVIDRIFGLANKYVYIAEAIGEPKKKVTKVKRPTGYTALDWIDLIAPRKPKDIRCQLVVRYRTGTGTYVGRFML